MRPRVTIVVPTRDRCRLLPATLRSARGQTLSSIEIVVVDDGSVDETPQLTARMSREDPRIRTIRRRAEGQAAARNAGLAAARADWVCFLDDDDLLAPQAVERLLGAAVAGVAAVACHCVRFFGEDPAVSSGEVLSQPERHRVGPWPPAPPDSPLTLRTLIARPQVPIHAALFRKDVLLEAGGFDRELRAAEDYALWLRVVARGPVPVLAEPLALYRWHSRQLRGDQRLHSRETRRALERFAADHPALASQHAAILRRRRAELLREEAYEALREGDRAGTWTAASAALRIEPFRVRPWVYLSFTPFPRLFRIVRPGRGRRG